MHKGKLFLVATPIGNLEDITFRAIRVLKEVDLIAAEDTRHALKLLTHFSIRKQLISYWSEREKAQAEKIIERLLNGLTVALISDAGTPGIADPGSILIARAIAEGVTVIPVPGPTALVAALSVSGLPTEEFTFAGFLPSGRAQRQKRLQDLALEPRTLVFYEAPHRIVESLVDMAAILKARRCALIREITKFHEEIIRGKLHEIAASIKERIVAGEYVVIVEGKSRETVSPSEALQEVAALMRRGKGRKESVRIVAESYGMSKKELYEMSLERR